MVHHILIGSLLILLTTSADAAGRLVAIKGLKWDTGSSTVTLGEYC